MTTLLLTATDNASTQTPDTRRISEHDSDFVRLHDRTLKKLRASLRQLVRDLEATPWHLRSERDRIAAAFIHRHTALLAQAYEQAHQEGQRDYYTPTSNTPSRWIRPVPQARISRSLRFYALGSVRRLAVEALAAVQPHDHAITYSEAVRRQIFTTDAYSMMLADDSHDWIASVDVRLVGQAQVTWAGLQDGYYDGGLYDTANPYYYVFWDLEPFVKTQHCDTCIAFADGSPYTPPGSGTGHELPATPGDGTSECGAGCKCSLRYGGAEEVKTATAWRDYQQTLRQMGNAGLLDTERTNRTGQMLTLDNEPSDTFTALLQPDEMPANSTAASDQRAAQDAYRSVWDRWDIVRGSLPQMPRLAWMFDQPDQLDGLTFEAFIDALPDRAQQTPEQQRVLRQWVEAILRFGSGGEDVDLRESAADDAIALYSPDQQRDSHGRFAYEGRDVHGQRMPFTHRELEHGFTHSTPIGGGNNINETIQGHIGSRRGPHAHTYVFKVIDPQIQASHVNRISIEQQQRNEAATVAGLKALHMGDLGPTEAYHVVRSNGQHISVVRKEPGIEVKAHVQRGWAADAVPIHELQRAYLASYLLGMRDRHDGNMLIDHVPQQVHLIDHGFSLKTNAKAERRDAARDLWQLKLSRAGQSDQLHDMKLPHQMLHAALHQEREVVRALQPFKLSHEERHALRQRFQALRTLSHNGQRDVSIQDLQDAVGVAGVFVT